MSLRFLCIRVFVPAACLLSAMSLAVRPSFGQQTPPASAQPPATTQPAQPAAQTQAPLTLPPVSKDPDYPEPRSFTIGIFGLSPLSSAGPDIRGGIPASQNNTYESLYGIGAAYRIVPQIEFSLPVTRTGTVYFDIERFHGYNNQTLTRDSFIDSYPYVAGDTISPTYKIISARLYLDDLLFPHKFPVARLRFKSIWGVHYLGFSQTVDSPSEDAIAGSTGSSFETGSNFILYPELGAAMEYAITPHVLFRIDGEGFAIPHHSDLNESNASLSFRRRNLEVLLGVKTLHFKTTPQKEEYEIGTFISPFLGLRWHW